MDPKATLEAFDQQIRRRLEPETPDSYVEHDRHVVRTVSGEDGWTGVTWSNLDATNADTVIAAQISRFSALSRPWEWKHYSYDQPSDLPERLVAAGFVPDAAEALLVAEITDLSLEVRPPAGIELRPVADGDGVDALISVGDEVFGHDHAGLGRRLKQALEQQPRQVEAVVAWAGTTPVSAARVEFNPGTAFAGLWGGGTLPAWRGHGIFRSLVAYRAALASARGYQYLQVDASPDSRPILERLGFAQLATTTPFMRPGSAGQVSAPITTG